MEGKEDDLKVSCLILSNPLPPHPTIYFMMDTKEVIFQLEKDCSMTVTKEGKVTIRGIDGESEATPAIYYALRKFLGVSEE